MLFPLHWLVSPSNHLHSLLRSPNSLCRREPCSAATRDHGDARAGQAGPRGPWGPCPQLERPGPQVLFKDHLAQVGGAAITLQARRTSGGPESCTQRDLWTELGLLQLPRRYSRTTISPLHPSLFRCWSFRITSFWITFPNNFLVAVCVWLRHRHFFLMRPLLQPRLTFPS